jgi:hypothetical protein
MATDVEIVNRALAKIGHKRITTLADATKEAREASAMFDIVRDALIRRYNWKFAIKRASVTVDATAPAWGFSKRYDIPSDCLRILQVGEVYPLDLSDYVQVNTDWYTIEDGWILTDLASPLKIKYLYRVTDEAKFDATFVEAFACKLGMELAEVIAGSTGKTESLMRQFQMAIRDALAANAIEAHPARVGSDTWALSRL